MDAVNRLINRPLGRLGFSVGLASELQNVRSFNSLGRACYIGW